MLVIKRIIDMSVSCKILSLLLFLSVGMGASAQEQQSGKWRAAFYGGLYINNEQAWLLEPSVTWRFHDLLGLSVGLEMTRQYNQPSRMTVIDGYDAVLTDNDRNVGWIILKPSVMVRTPDLWKNTDGSCRLGCRPSRASPWPVRFTIP